jgi:uncharacterized protein (DUF1697 family)
MATPMTTYVALLRGINVGGKHPIRMPELVACFEALGARDVRTYIQSGNVLFTHRGARPREERFEAAILERFGFDVPVVLRTREEMAATIAAAPADHGAPHLRSDAMFLKAPLTAEQAFAQFPEPRPGVDAVALGPGVVYFSRVASRASQTRLTRVMALPIYRQMTIRNWRTVTAIADMLDAMPS